MERTTEQEDIGRALHALYETEGRRRYGLESISQCEHALQTAALAEANREPSAMILAALLHDVGHLIAGTGEDVAKEGIDDRHEMIGAGWLDARLGQSVSAPVRLHVAAKRYLCAADASYMASLAPDSVLSLSLQGGPMSEQEVAAFLAEPFAQDAIRLRRLDEMAKDPDARTPPIEHFLQYLRLATPVRHD
jgi:phosphonate degradation associated HDIG domain protein